MALVKAKARQDEGVSRVSDGGDVYVRALRDGSLVDTDWIQALILEGRGFMFNVGSFSSPLVGGGAGAAMDIDQPEFVVRIPKGTSILPVRIEIAQGKPVGAADNDEVDLLIAVDQDSAQTDGTAAVDPETVYNMNTLHSRASNCVVRSAFTGDITDPVLDLELARYNSVYESHSLVDGEWTGHTLIYEPETPPIINGPAMLVGYWGGTQATEAFASVQYVEIPSELVTG